jgi:hypothetical protein
VGEMSKLKIMEVVNRASFLSYKPKLVLKFDLSNLDEIGDIKKVVVHFKNIVEKMPKKSMVGLVDISGLKVTEDVAQEMISLTEFCNPYFRASAVIANDLEATGLANSVVNHFEGINLPIHPEEETAKKWLFSQ